MGKNPSNYKVLNSFRFRLLRPLTCPSIFKKSVSKTKSEKRPSIFTLNLELSREILEITIKVIPSFRRGNDRKMILDLSSKDQIISAFSEFDLDQDQDHQKWSRSWSYRSLDQIFQRTVYIRAQRSSVKSDHKKTPSDGTIIWKCGQIYYPKDSSDSRNTEIIISKW